MDMNRNHRENLRYHSNRPDEEYVRYSSDEGSPPPSPPRFNKQLGRPVTSAVYMRDRTYQDEDGITLEEAIHPRRCNGCCFWFCLAMLGAFVVIATVASVLIANHVSKGKKPNPPPPPSPPPPPLLPPVGKAVNYTSVLSMGLLFYDAQKSGKLPADNPIPWRGDSCLDEGKYLEWDLVGGYYDAGDHMKYVFPMAFSMTTLAWSIIEFPEAYKAGDALEEAQEKLRWGTDFLLKAWRPELNNLAGMIGNATDDRSCWQPPEYITKLRPVEYLTQTQVVGTDLAFEVSAALAAASIVFQKVDLAYSKQLVNSSFYTYIYAFNDNKANDKVLRQAGYRKYSDNPNFADAAMYYPSSGYSDELLWATAWIYKASMNVTGTSIYFDFATYVDFLDWILNDYIEFSWDQKMLGAQVLLLQSSLVAALPKHNNTLEHFKRQVGTAMCKWMDGNPLSLNGTLRTPGYGLNTGLLHLHDKWPNLYASGAAFLASVYGDFLNTTGTTLSCGDSAKAYTWKDLQEFAKSQVDYMLGRNPYNQSYVVGFGSKYPQQPYHMGASFPDSFSTIAICGATGEYFLNVNQSNPNTLLGALVGGPDKNDMFNDTRSNSDQTEPSLVTQSLFMGALAAVSSHYPVVQNATRSVKLPAT